MGEDTSPGCYGMMEFEATIDGFHFTPPTPPTPPTTSASTFSVSWSSVWHPATGSPLKGWIDHLASGAR